MLQAGDPDASVGLAVGMGAIAAALGGYAVSLVRPLFGRGR